MVQYVFYNSKVLAWSTTAVWVGMTLLTMGTHSEWFLSTLNPVTLRWIAMSTFSRLVNTVIMLQEMKDIWIETALPTFLIPQEKTSTLICGTITELSKTILSPCGHVFHLANGPRVLVAPSTVSPKYTSLILGSLPSFQVVFKMKTYEIVIFSLHQKKFVWKLFI